MTDPSEPIWGQRYQPGGEGFLNALQQFYHAFNQADLDLMRKNWLQGPEACMANPLGGLRRGWTEIEPVYRRVFHGPAQVFVEFHDYCLYPLAEAMLVVGRERGYVERDGQRLELAIRTSRVYQQVSGQWRQLHHHGSVEDPELLRAYRSLVG